MSEKQPLRQSYTFYLSFEEGLRHLDDHDELIMRRALSRYALYGEMPDLPGYLMLGFTSWKANVDSSNERRETSAANGKRGGAPKGNQNARKHPKEENNLEQPKTTQNNLEQSNINITMKLKETMNDKENVNTGSAGPDSRSRPCINTTMNTTPNIDIEAEENWEREDQCNQEKKHDFKSLPSCTNVVSIDSYEDFEDRKEYWKRELTKY